MYFTNFRAMKYWYFKFWNFEWVSKQLQNGSLFIDFSRSRNFSGQVGDKVVLLVLKDSEWLFLYKTKIKMIEKESSVTENGKTDYTVIFDNQTVIDEPNGLKDYAYTLTKIRKYNSPLRNFSRSYGLLTVEDYNSIIKGRIFYARTIFGKLVNSMHPQHRLQFTQILVRENPELYFKNKNYKQLTNLLQIYIEDYILIQTRFLRTTYKMLNEIVVDFPTESIGILDNGDTDNDNQTDYVISNRKRIHYIQEQVEIINRYRDILNSGFWGEVDSFWNQEREQEIDFNKLFNGRSLPIDLEL